MMRKVVVVVAAAVGLLVPFCSVLAHHGAAGYDMTKVVTMKGTITKFEWGNPHSQIYFDVTDDKGNVAHWDAETEPPPVMLERGWTRKSLNPGDEVTVYCYTAKNGATTAVLQKVVLANGKELTARGGGGGQ
jgi:Family of unknown function (DUF6152)